MTLFERRYELTIGKAGQAGFLIKDLDISFMIKKGQDSEKYQNKLTLKIYNLSNEHRNSLVSKNNLDIILKAGYENSLTTVFQGKITRSTSKKNGVDFETDIEAGDGYIALREAKTSKSFPPSTNALQIVQALCRDLIAQDPDLAMGTIYSQEILSKKNFLNGYSACGFTKSELKKILTPLKMSFSIQNEIIYIASIDSKTQLTEVFLLSKTSGLINSPQKLKNDPQALKNEQTPMDGVTFECLLNGALNPMNMVKIKSDAVNGVYKIIETEYTGEYLCENWQTKCTAVEVK